MPPDMQSTKAMTVAAGQNKNMAAVTIKGVMHPLSITASGGNKKHNKSRNANIL